MWRGEAVQWWLEDDVWAYARVDPETGDASLTVINRTGEDRWLTNAVSFAGLPTSGTLEDVLTGDTFTIADDSVSFNVPPVGSRVFVAQ